jgi:branched-chain amino acid transport system substrate-binding protein
MNAVVRSTVFIGLFTAVTAVSFAQTGNKPIDIGAVLGFSGLLKPYEGEGFVTAQLAAEDINSSGGIGGRKIEFITKDTKSDPNLASQAALDAINDGAEIVMTSDYDFGGPAARVAIAKGMLAMSMFASPPKFGPSGLGPLAFSAGIMTTDEAAVASEFAFKRGWRTAYELEDTSIEYTRSFHKYFREAWATLGGKLVGRDTWQNSDLSLATQITKIKSLAQSPDFIVMSTYNPGGTSAVRQLREAGINVPLLSGQPMDGNYWVGAVPNLTDFYVSTYASYVGDDSDPFVNQLRERFRSKTGQYPTLGYFVTGYNAIDLLGQGIKAAKSTDGKTLAKILESQQWTTKPLGKTCFTREWHVSSCRPFAIMEIREAQPHFIGRFEPSFVPQP